VALFPAPREARCAACVLRSMAARRKTTLGWIGIPRNLVLSRWRMLRCGLDSWGGRCLSVADYVTVMVPTGRAPAAGGG